MAGALDAASAAAASRRARGADAAARPAPGARRLAQAGPAAPRPRAAGPGPPGAAAAAGAAPPRLRRGLARHHAARGLPEDRAAPRGLLGRVGRGPPRLPPGPRAGPLRAVRRLDR